MSVDISDPFAHQPALFDEEQDLFVAGDRCLRKAAEQVEHVTPMPERAACKLADDKWMGDDFCQVERAKRGRFAPEVINPDRTVDEDHAGLRLGGAAACGSLPPRRTRRRTASRAISALRPS